MKEQGKRGLQDWTTNTKDCLKPLHRKLTRQKIPKYIQSIVSDYVYILRKYPSEMYAWGGKTFYSDYMQQNNELVLYAIPRERYIGQ